MKIARIDLGLKQAFRVIKRIVLDYWIERRSFLEQEENLMRSVLVVVVCTVSVVPPRFKDASRLIKGTSKVSNQTLYII